MKIHIVTPAPPGSNTGNRVTARRWAGMLRALGHRVRIESAYSEKPCGLLIALHARRSFQSVKRFRTRYPSRPLIVALTGTDIYRDLRRSIGAGKSIAWATRLIVLQPAAIREIPRPHRSKARVIYQSVRLLRGSIRARRREGVFEVCVLGHLRPVKDPFRTAAASRLLPPKSKIRVLHIGEALTDGMRQRAVREEKVNPRYRWLGGRGRNAALRYLSRSRILVLSSRLEGGANVISEAIAASIPVLSSRIPGSEGILGNDYPGYFPVGDSKALASLLSRAEEDPRFYADLRARCVKLSPLVDPSREMDAWKHLLNEL